MSKDRISDCAACANWTQRFGPPENNGPHIAALAWRLFRCAVTGGTCGPTVMNCGYFAPYRVIQVPGSRLPTRLPRE